jgi:hypothetical protein
MWFANFIMISFSIVMLIGVFFMFDEVILRGYFATKLRKRFNVEDLK